MLQFFFFFLVSFSGLIKDPDTGNFYQSIAPEHLKILFKMAFVLINISSSNFDWVQGGHDLHAFTSLALTLCKKGLINFLFDFL